MDYYTFYNNRARKANNAQDKKRFTKMANKYKPAIEPRIEECQVEIVEQCSIEIADKPKKGRKPKVEKEKEA